MNLFQPLEHVSHGQYFIFHTEATFLFGDEQATDVTELLCLRQERTARRGCTLSMKRSIQEWLHPTDGPALWHRRWCTHVGMEQTLTLQDRGGLPGGGVFTEQVYSCSTKMFPFFGEISPLFAVSGWSYSFRSSRRGECKGRWYNIFDAMWDVKHLLSIGKSSRQCFWFNSSKSAHFLWPGWSWPCASPGKKPSHLL